MTTNQTPILIISSKVVQKNSKIDWPDLNYPGSGQTILRTIHDIDHLNFQVQLDGIDGPRFSPQNFPEGVGFYVPATTEQAPSQQDPAKKNSKKKDNI